MPFRTHIGHRRTIALLARAVGARTLPPCLLLTGPEGVGKRQAALALAQALNCERPLAGVAWPPAGGEASEGPFELAADACGECTACRRIARGLHVDVVVLEPEESGSIKIDRVREVLGQVAYRPFEGRRRVVIVDAADALVLPAQNALLKSLEEPPAGTVFVLVSSQPDLLLDTVRSRCPRIRFARLAPGEIAGALVRVHGVEPARADALAAVAAGSLGAAVQASASGIETARAAAHRTLERLAGARDGRGRLEVAARELSGRTKGTGASERDALAVHLRALGSLLRDLGVLATRADEQVLANRDLRDTLAALVPAFDRDRLVRAFSAVDRALAALERNASPKVVADWVVLQI